MDTLGNGLPCATFPAATVATRGVVHHFEVRFDAGSVPAFAVRTTSGVRAYINACPHFGVRLDARGEGVFDARRRHLVCGTHGALFRPQDGRCTQGPCLGDQLDALQVVELFGACQVFVPNALAAALRERLRVTPPGG